MQAPRMHDTVLQRRGRHQQGSVLLETRVGRDGGCLQPELEVPPPSRLRDASELRRSRHHEAGVQLRACPARDDQSRQDETVQRREEEVLAATRVAGGY